MAFCRASFTFGLQHLQSVDDGGTGVFRLDYDVYHAAHCCLVRSCKVIDIFFRFCFYIRIIFEDVPLLRFLQSAMQLLGLRPNLGNTLPGRNRRMLYGLLQ